MEPTKTHPLKNQKPAKEKVEPNSSTAEMIKKLTPNQHMKIVSFACLEASLRYREVFWRDDVEAYHVMLENNEPKTGSFSQLQKVKKETAAKVLDFELKIKKFSDECYRQLAEFNQMFSAQNQIKFDNYATAYGLLADEMIKANNTTELLTVCRIYNAGQMKEAFQQLKHTEELNKEFEAKSAEKNNVGEPIDIPAPEVKLEVVRDEELGPEI